MEPREFLNTPEGFVKIIEDEEHIIAHLIVNAEKGSQFFNSAEMGIQFNNDPTSVSLSYRELIISSSQRLIFAKYSAGSMIEDIKEYYLFALNEMGILFKERTVESFSDCDSEPYFCLNEYWEIMQLLALGILLDVNEPESAQLLLIRDKVATQDIILDFLCSYFDKREVGFNQARGNKYNGLAQFIMECTPENAPTLMKAYLNEQWFKDFKRQMIVCMLPIHGVTSHCGYWSFESGAVMKILQADDSILKGQQFYPYDMVHWQ